MFRLAQSALGEEFFHTRTVRLCDVTWQSQSHAVACETSCHLVMRDFTHTVVHDDDVQAVEQLALVLVDSLHMDVKHGGWVYFHPVFLLQVLREFHLVVLWEKQNIHDLKKKRRWSCWITGAACPDKMQCCNAQINQIVIPLPAIGPEKIYVVAIRVKMHGFMVQQDI